MAETTPTKSADSEPTSLDDPVLVRHLTTGATNPNLPRSLFISPTAGAADVTDDGYISVNDGTNVPGKGFKEKSIKGQAIQMKTGFDANGNPGNAGDWLVHVAGHWFVAKDKDM